MLYCDSMYIKDTSSAINIYMKMNRVFSCLLPKVLGSFRKPPEAPSAQDTRRSHDAFLLSEHPCPRFAFCFRADVQLQKPNSLVHHIHLRICASWRPSWNAFMARCGLFFFFFFFFGWRSMDAPQEAGDRRCYQALTPDPCRKTERSHFPIPK